MTTFLLITPFFQTYGYAIDIFLAISTAFSLVLFWKRSRLFSKMATSDLVNFIGLLTI
jgi:hypothetical protein